jgi:fibronectin-binding autotransporter adhesin
MALKFLNDGYFAGKVGIGTDTPTYKLVVGGDVDYSSGIGTTNAIFVQDANYPAVVVGVDNQNYGYIKWDVSGGYLSIATKENYANQDNTLVLKTSKVGIGTTNPGAKLDILGAEIAGGVFTGTTPGIVRVGGGSFNVDDIIALDFGSSSQGGGTAPLARVGTRLTGSGSYLHFGTSNSYGSGVTNTAMSIDPSGNVGIGTPSPGAKLDVSGEVRTSSNFIADNATLGSLSLRISGTETGRLDNYNSALRLINFHASSATVISGNADISIESIGSSAIKFSTSNAEKMRIDSAGNVGIGTTSPGYKLDVAGEVRANNLFRTTDGTNIGLFGSSVFASNVIGVGSSNAVPLVLGTSATERMRILANGNVGIGTVSPAYKLTVNGDVDVNNGAILAAQAYGINLGVSGYDILMPTTTRIAIKTSASERVSILNTGNVGIGTTSPSQKLHVAGGRTYLETGNEIYTLGISRSGANAYYLGVSNSGSPDLYFSNNAGTTRVTLTDAGNVGIGVTGPLSKLHVNGGNISIQNVDSSSPYTASGKLRFLGRYDRYLGGINTVNTGSYAEYDNGLDFYVQRDTFDAAGHFAMRINHLGNVGIGTTSPSNRLEIVGPYQATPLKVLRHADYGNVINIGRNGISETANIGYPADATMNFSTNGSERVRITSSGNVGIGTTSPLSQLSIGSNAITTKKPTVVIADGVAGGSLVIRGLSPILSFDRTGASPENKILMDGVGLEFKTGTLDAEGDVDFKIKLDGKLQAPAYTQGFLQSDASGNIEISGGGTLPGGPYLPLAGGTMTTGAVVTFLDSSGSTDNRLKLGTGGDMQLFHDGSDAYVDQTGTGDLILRTSGSGDDVFIRAMDDVFIQPKNGEAGVYIYSNGAVELYYNGSKKFETTSTGVTVTGALSTTDDITISNTSPEIYLTNTNALKYNWMVAAQENVDQAFEITPSTAVGGSIFNAPALRIDGGTSNATFAGDATVNGTIATLNTADYGTIRFGSNGNRYIRGNSAELQIGSTLNNIHFQSTGANRIDSGSADGTAAFRINARTSHTSGNLFEVTNANSIKLAIDYDGDTTFTTQAFATVATSSGDASSTLTTKGYVDSLITGATIYRGTWDPDVALNSGYGSPNLSTVTHTSGYYYICSADGAATPNGTTTEPNTWNTGDWVIWNDDVGVSGEWQKIDNSSVLSGVGTGQTVALWEGANSVTDSETLGNAPITVSGNNATFAGNVSLTSTSPILYLNNTTASTGKNWRLSSAANGNAYITQDGVVDAITLSHTSGNATFAGSINAGNNIVIGSGGTYQAGNIYSDANWGMIFRALQASPTYADFLFTNSADVERFRISSNGNAVFAGTIDSGTITSTGIVKAATTFQATSGDMTFYVNNVGEAMRIQQNTGNVGIGDTTPSSKLQVAGGIQMADDTDTASATKVGTMRYRTGTEYVEVTGVDLLSGWDFTSGWTSQGGGTVINGTSFSAFNNAGIYKSILVSGNTYKMVVSGNNTSSNGTAITDFPETQSYSSLSGTFSETFYFQANGTNLFLTNNSSGTTTYVLLSVVEVTAEDASYADMCMQTGASTYEWVNIVRNTY